MQNSGISSLGTPSGSQPPKGPTRKRFALTGRSARVDPRTQAIRRDLADVRLAEHFFAPHYAAPLPRVLAAAADLRAGREPDADVIARLPAGETFEMLELSGGLAWGVAPRRGIVGYVDASLLADPCP